MHQQKSRVSLPLDLCTFDDLSIKVWRVISVKMGYVLRWWGRHKDGVVKAAWWVTFHYGGVVKGAWWDTFHYGG